MKIQDRHIEAVEQMLKYINEHGGDDKFIERYLDHAEQALLDLVVAAEDLNHNQRG